MKPGPSLFLAFALAAALAAAPALAQRSVSGTIGAAHAAQPAAPASATSAPAVPAASETVPAAAVTAPAAPSNAAETTSAAGAAASAAATTTAATTTAAAPSGPLAMTIPPPQAASPATGGGLLQTTFALLFVLALVVGTAWFLKRFGPKNFGGGNSNIKLVGALSVGTRERILVVEVGEQWIVVGASPGRMNALATMPRQEGALDEAMAPPAASANFAEWFKQTIEKRNGK